MSEELENKEPVRFGTHPWGHKEAPIKEDEIIIHLRNVMQTQSGVEVMRYLRRACGADETIVDLNELGEPNMALMMKNAGLQKFWLDLRRLIYKASRDRLIEIEIPPGE